MASNRKRTNRKSTGKTKKPTAKTARKVAARKPPPRERLPGFFRKLYAQPRLMAQFSSGAAGRKQVLEKTDLTMEHRKVLATGCLPDMLRALSGAPYPNTTIDVGNDTGTDDQLCTHADCQAFRAARRS